MCCSRWHTSFQSPQCCTVCAGAALLPVLPVDRPAIARKQRILSACVAMQYTMRVVSGGIAGSAFIVLFLGASGLINLLLQYISPITGVTRCARTCPAQQPTSLCWDAVQAGSHPSRALQCCCFALGGSARPAASAGWLPCSTRGHSDPIQQPPLPTAAYVDAAWLTAQQSPLQDSSRCIYYCTTTWFT